MVQIQKTVSITEAINERIKVLGEDLAEHQQDLLAIQTSYNLYMAKKGTYNLLFILTCFLLAISILLMIIYGTDGVNDPITGLSAIIAGLLVGVIDRLYDIRKNLSNSVDMEKLEELEKIVEDLQNSLSNAKKEKQDILLQFDQEIQSVKNLTDGAEVLEANKECPMCAEKIKMKAKICRFCGYQFYGGI